MLRNFIVKYRRTLAIGGGAAFLLLLGGLAWLERLAFIAAPQDTLGTAPPPVGVSNDEANGDESAALPQYSGAPISALAADQKFLQQVPAGVYEESIAELQELAQKLAANPGNTELWMRVAFIKRYYNDDAGARDAYEYLNRIAPFDPLPFYNVAVIYGYSLKDSERAIEKYQAAIRIDPKRPNFYMGFADFYRDVMRDYKMAEKILLDGLRELPDDPTLLVTLGLVYRLSGEIQKAIDVYERAYQSTQGAAERAAITAELERLRTVLP